MVSSLGEKPSDRYVVDHSAMRPRADHHRAAERDHDVVPLSPAAARLETGLPPVFSRIVCGVDGTRAGQVAARQAVALAEPGSDVLLVCARDSWRHPHSRTLIKRRVQDALEEACAAAHMGGVSCDVELADSPNPFELLLDRAEGADLLVVGSRGRSRGSGSALGTTAAMAVHACAASVLIARPPPRAAGFPHRILVGSDGSPSAAQARGVAAQIAWRTDAELCLLSAEPRLRGGQTALRDEILDLQRKAGRRIRVIRATGEPVEQLSGAARGQGASLLITGGRSPFRPGVTESVSARLAHRAGCSVLIAR